MKEDVSESTPCKDSTNEDLSSVDSLSSTSDTASGDSSSNAYDLGAIQDIILRYVGQLLQGCDNDTCKESMCATGRRNISGRPVREYTPRSARVLAITLAKSPRPRSRLCLNYVPRLERKVRLETTRDPLAYIQRLGDTTIIKKFCNPSYCVGKVQYNEPVFQTIRHWHNILDELATLPTTIVANKLNECLQWLTRQGPEGQHTYRDWCFANEFVRYGLAYPQTTQSGPCDDSEEVLLEMLDWLSYEPLFRLFCHILGVIGKKHAVESEAYMKDGINPYEGRASHTHSVESSICGKFVRRVFGEPGTCDFNNFRLDIILWLKKSFHHHWNGEVVLVKGTIASTTLLLLDNIYRDNDWKNDSLFIMATVHTYLDAAELVQSYLDTEDKHGVNHFLEFTFTCTLERKATYFRISNHLRMRAAHSDAEKAAAMHSRVYRHIMDMEPEGRLRYLEEHYLLLNIRRGHVLEDAFDQLWQRRRGELLRPLRVRLGEMDELEVGHDLGGVQIEFFNLVCKEVLRDDLQMFTTDPETALSYFCAGSLQPRYMFELCGLLFGLAMYNGITLPVSFPQAFYSRLSAKPTELMHIGDRWPSIKKSLESVLHDDIPGIEKTFPFEANGARLVVAEIDTSTTESSSRVNLGITDATRIVHHKSQHGTSEQRGAQQESRVQDALAVDVEEIAHAWPGWHLFKTHRQPEEVTARNKDEYVQAYVKWLTYDSVLPQWVAFERGFFSIIDKSPLHLFSPGDIAAIFEGTNRFSIHNLRQATSYVDYNPQSKYIQNFWGLVVSWPEAKQKQLLKFVTAIERIPIGAANAFKIERPSPENTDYLPTSSTCFRTLFLPKYSSVEVLDRKLTLAFKYGLEGFGTG